MSPVPHEVVLPSGTLSLTPGPGGMAGLDALCGFASRQNPKRAFLFVSKVLGKHIAARPSEMRQSHEQLAALLKPFLAVARSVLFLGFAETATGLGAGVYDACRALTAGKSCLFTQTTRYRFDRKIALDFHEEHSHATAHLVYEPTLGQDVFYGADSLVLVDDELTTGKTSVNFLRAFLQVNPHIRRVALVSLLSWIPPERLEQIRRELPGVDLVSLALLNGGFSHQANPGFSCPPMPPVDSNHELKDLRVPHSFGRFGYADALPWKFEAAEQRLDLDKARPVRVVGDGEFMHVPFLLADYLQAQGYDVRVQSTTRSPILVGGAIESRLQFPDHYGEGIDNFLYNAPPADAQVVLCHEAVGALHLPALAPLKNISFGELL